MRRAKAEMMSVYVLQEIAKSEKEAKQLLKEARKREESCLGGRVYAPAKARQKRWVVHTYYVDDGGRPPQGMARLTIPSDRHVAEHYGIKAAS